VTNIFMMGYIIEADADKSEMRGIEMDVHQGFS
jgi:hypothetical protein